MVDLRGFDYRVKKKLVDTSISAGNYVTMGGEAPATIIVESVVG